MGERLNVGVVVLVLVLVLVLTVFPSPLMKATNIELLNWYNI